MSADPTDNRLRRAFDLNRFSSHQRAIAAEIGSRVEWHRGAVAQLAAFPEHRPLNLLANGDSWFDYPLGGALPGEHTDVIAALGRMGSPAPLILNLAHYGDTSVQELGLARQQHMVAALSDARHGRFDGILVSAGGNDIAGDALVIWLEMANEVAADPARAINRDRFAGALEVIHASYLDLVSIRDRLLPGAPIFAHSYDFPLPTGQGVCTLGPWLRPALEYCGWKDEAVGAHIIRSMLDQFGKTLDQIAASVTNFIHVQTQGTLHLVDWANELHPTPDGFQLIADKFRQALGAHFPGRI